MQAGVSSWRFIVRYFVENGINITWTLAGWEVEGCFSENFKCENPELLRDVAQEGRGLLVVAAHIGPRLNSRIILRLRNDLKYYIAKNGYFAKKDFNESLPPSLKSKEFTFVVDPERVLVAGLSEKETVAHIRKKRHDTDAKRLPAKNESCETVDLFGLPINFHYFPFKLALKYDCPVIFAAFIRDGKRGYKMRFTSLGPFETPQEGVLKFFRLSFRRISKDCPFQWRMLSNPAFIKHMRENHGRIDEALTAIKV